MRVLNKPSFKRTRPTLLQRILARSLRIFANRLNDDSFFTNPQKLKTLNVFSGYGEYLELFHGKEDVLRTDFLQNVSKLKCPITLGNSRLNIVIHLRLGDISEKHYQPGMQYDLKKLDRLLADLKTRYGHFNLLLRLTLKA